jgi:chromosome segregation ATPase
MFLQAKKDRVRYDTEISRSDGFLESLPADDLGRWPEPVKALVASQVAAAVEDARTVLQQEAEAAVEVVEVLLNGAQQQLAESQAMVAAMSERIRVSQEHSQHLETELREQEIAMQAQISELQVQLQQASAGKSLKEVLEAERHAWQVRFAARTSFCWAMA